eukprot:2912780-Prymnesium_polylepis.1
MSAGANDGEFHLAPFQPSPKLSCSVRTQAASSGASMLPVNGAPPERVVPSAQPTDQETSVG